MKGILKACGRPRPTRDNRWVSSAAALATMARRLLTRLDAGSLLQAPPASRRGKRRATVASAAPDDTFDIEVGGPGVRVARRLRCYAVGRGVPPEGPSPRLTASQQAARHPNAGPPKPPPRLGSAPARSTWPGRRRRPGQAFAGWRFARAGIVAGRTGLGRSVRASRPRPPNAAP